MPWAWQCARLHSLRWATGTPLCSLPAALASVARPALVCCSDDVYKTCEELEAKGVGFKKRPDEGRMKGLAFAYDPDKYWIEIIKRPEGTGVTGFCLNQTMIRSVRLI